MNKEIFSPLQMSFFFFILHCHWVDVTDEIKIALSDFTNLNIATFLSGRHCMYLNVTGFMLNLIKIVSSGQLFNYSAVMLFSRDTD